MVLCRRLKQRPLESKFFFITLIQSFLEDHECEVQYYKVTN